MKTVYLNGQALRLTKEIGAGQEAVVYDMGNGQVAKVYRIPNDPIMRNLRKNRKQR